ncbi:MAG: TldD/PmbA family protein [Spirochaetaceae bacterium]|nr:MAG: TldD/PmbA family protein [Spirochaetaceae bacterium]
MKVPLSAYLTNNKHPLSRLVRILSREFPYVSILSTDSIGMRYSVRGRVVDVRQSDWCERGSVIRIHDGHGYSEYSFNSLEGDEQKHIESLAAEIRDRFQSSSLVVQQLPFNRPKLPAIIEQPLSGTWQGEVGILPDTVDVAETTSRLTALKDRAFAESPYLVDMEVRFEYMRVSKLFVSNKRELEQSYLWTQGYLIPVVRRDEATREMYASYSGLKGVELIDEMEAGLPETMNIAVQLLDAGRIEPGEYEVILSPGIAGLLAHESFGHGVETDMFVKGRAKAADYIGKSVASTIVNLHDGARAAEQTGSYWFDDEGVLGGDSLVIENGIFRNGISDLLSALRLGTSPTGNGKRESFERKAYARMTNTFFTAGSDSLEQMIASVKNGYLLEKFLSGMEDPKNWGIQGQILYAREIRDGKLNGRIVSPLFMFGYVPEVLGSVSMLSGEVQLAGSGMCGKGHKEYVKTSFGGPYMKTVMRLG